MKQICILLSIFVITFFVFSANRHAQLQDNMYPQKAEAVELSGPSIISLSLKELSYHHSVAVTLLSAHGAPNLLEKVQIADIHKSYARMLYKTGMVTKTETISDKIIVYYVYVFLNKNTVAKGFTVQSLRVVCIWENDKIILDSGFKKDCNVNNEWLYWENKSCPSMKELEHELKKAFNFEQIEKKGKEKRKEGQMTLFFNKKKPTLIQIGF